MDALEEAKSANVVELAARYTRLKHYSGQEYAGPCPRCKGEDRFHATKEWWFCRQCSPKRGDAPGFLQFVDGLPFAEAVAELAGGRRPERTDRPALTPAERRERVRDVMLRQSTGRVPVAEPAARKVHDAEWTRQAETIVTEAHETLLDSVDNPGAVYLRGRGLEPGTWEAFNLGFGEGWSREAQAKLPAIVIPWYRAGKICAIRYRFLRPVGKQKTASLGDSQFGGVLYGGQTAVGVARHLRTLVLCEGELNAASIWQVAGPAKTDVLSIGSETQMLTPAAVAFISEYRQVIVWMDRAEIARQLMAVLPRSVALNSPDGKDANDMLQAGLLGGVIATMRRRGANTWEMKQALVWDYADARDSGFGDAGAEQVAREVAEELGLVYG